MTEAAVRPDPNTGELKLMATEIVQKTPPGDVFLSLIGGLFATLGWLLGRAWFFSAHTLVFCGLAMKYGYWKGAKVPADQRMKKAAPRQQ